MQNTLSESGMFENIREDGRRTASTLPSGFVGFGRLSFWTMALHHSLALAAYPSPFSIKVLKTVSEV